MKSVSGRKGSNLLLTLAYKWKQRWKTKILLMNPEGFQFTWKG